jgi:hypothetical protein
MFCAPGLIFGGTGSGGSHFHILRSWTHFRRYRGRRLFCTPELIFGSTNYDGPIFMFYATGLIFGGTEGVGSDFNVLCSLTRFSWYRGRWVPFSYFARPYLFSAVSRVSGGVFMFCALKLIFGGTEGVRSRFHVLRSRAYFRRYRGRQLPFSSFAFPNSFTVVSTTPGHVFMYCAPGLIFDGSEGVGSRFHFLRSRTRFRRYRGRQVPFSYFALLDSFSAVPRASAPIFMFYAP